MTICEQITERFPIRKTAAQKKAFRQWVMGECAQMGYTARIEENDKGRQQNIIVGDPEHAEVTFTAHYDTPSTILLPDLHIPRNFPVYLLWQIGMIGGMLALAFLVGLALGLLTRDGDLLILGFFGAFVAMMWLQLNGVANKHNVNDNTSGVAAVLETMAKVPAEHRAKTAFILFDNEEKGCRGSGAYAKAHPAVKESGFLVNLDCVGDGEHILFIAKEKNRGMPQYAALTEALQAQNGRMLHIFPMEGSMLNSDQKNFKASSAVCACNEDKRLGFVCDRIHTSEDTVCDQANLDFLADAFAAFIARL